MEILKKTILQAVRTEVAICTGCTGMCRYDLSNKNAYYIKYGCTKIKIEPILDGDFYYHLKIGLIQHPQDIGLFDALEIVTSPEENQLVDSNGDIFTDSNNDIFIE